MGKKSKKTVYYDYYISMHLGFCHGPVDSVEQVYFKEKPVLDSPLIANTSVQINKPDLFGGYEREGGIVGTLHYMAGTLTQLIPSALARRLKLTPETAPGFRGIMSLFLCGDDNSDRDGANISSNYPSVPPMWARVRRASRSLGVNNPIIVSKDEKRYNSNPASMIHEALTNPWMMGGDPNDIDLTSFTQTAATLADEGLGLSMLWTEQMAIEQFVQEILNHIKALYFVNPFTGKGTLKLLRNDYNPATLRQYGPDNVRLMNFRRKLWGETVNEISVQYTVPDTEEQDTVTYQDPGNIAMQGDIVGETRNYYGIRDIDTAVMVCLRDLQEAAAPLATATIKANRMVWRELPGDCIRFTWPAHGIENTVMRVMEIDWGKIDDSEITINLIEDIFGLAQARFELPGPPAWEDPDDDPNDGTLYENLPVKFFAAPYTLIQQELPEEERENYLDPARYPEIIIAAAVTPKPPEFDEQGNLVSEGQDDLQSFIMNTPTTDTTGEIAWDSAGEKQLTGRAKIVDALPQEVKSDILLAEKYGGDGPAVGRYAIITSDPDGTTADSEKVEEWIMFESKLGPSHWRVVRGVMDTIPMTWQAGAAIFFISESFDAYDTAGSLAFQPESFKLQARTSLGIRDLDLTPTTVTQRLDRPYLPYRPANIDVAGTKFGYLNHTQDNGTPSDFDDDTHNPREFVLPISWANRDMTMEETLIQHWDMPTLPLPVGQTTEIIIKVGGEEIERIVGLTGTSYDFDLIAWTKRYTRLDLQFVSRYLDRESLQGLTITVGLYRKGFGSDFGYMYGGWPGDDGILTEIEESELTLPSWSCEGTAEIDMTFVYRLSTPKRVFSFGAVDQTLLPAWSSQGTGTVGA